MGIKYRPYGPYTGYTISLEDAKKDVGPGWRKLISALWAVLPSHARIIQIKEKFGGLRVYVDNIDENMHTVISAIEHLSTHICENCGDPGQCEVINGWYSTRCEKCR
jgi:hypothetical protein